MPRLLAEALVELDDPLSAILASVPERPVAAVVGAIAAALAPPEAAVEPPDWLRADQRAPFRRVLAALDRHGGALLADPVGSGKTWVALAVARALGRRTVVLLPAALETQWHGAARRAGVGVEIHTLECASRGGLPRRAGLVIVDECHRLRHPGTRRYRALAPWLTGSRVLLLSATPVVNRLADLAHQLLLAVADDTLLPAGCPSLRAALLAGVAPPALGALVIRRPEPADLPATRRHRCPWPLTGPDREILTGLVRLRCSRHPAIRALVQGSLLGAFASSPAALATTLDRYHRLLGHARAASAAGRQLTRRDLRLAVGPDPEQLVMWELWPDGLAPVELALDDAPGLEVLRRQVRARLSAPDARLDRLRELLHDGRPTVVFTQSLATLAWLRQALAALRPAWLSGGGAGVGQERAPRAAVLAAFGPGQRAGPTTLLATDVAAEGLDLQRAARVVHFDLPWTAVRLAQRAGRVRRLGGGHPAIEIVTFLPPAELERRVRRVERLVAKSRLPGQAGLDAESRWLYRWRGELAPLSGGAVSGAVSAVHGAEGGWLVGLELPAANRPDPHPPARLFWIADSGEVDERPASVVPRLLAARDADERLLTRAERDALPAMVAPVVRTALADSVRDQWQAVPRPPEQRRLLGRLLRLAPRLAAARQVAALELVQRAIEQLARGLTAGEVLTAARLLRRPEQLLLHELRALQRRPPRGVPLPRLSGVVRVGTFPG